MGHDHSHAAPELKDINRAFYVGIGLNTLFTIIEFVVGYRTNSLALIADASHNLSDVMSLIISLLGMMMAQKAATKLYTYGYKKASILASLINAILILFIVYHIIKTGIERLSDTPEIAGISIIFTALIGVVINTISAFLFWKGQKSDINIRGAFLHLLVDALVSVGVVLSGIIIWYTGWNIIDPLISFVIAIIILFLTWSLLKESLSLVIDGVPKNVDMQKVISLLQNHQAIIEHHHLHVWALSSSENAMTVHIQLDDSMPIEEHMDLKKTLKHQLLHQNIQHCTIELERNGEDCADMDC
ncbi:MAG: cation diffusion facilitator family transporter [Saprospiraceae bacterium]|nr:cation diffusion facilitator family transporter [Saprospiraceae bacterium]MDF1698502.1 cation diffusion facilitator family transporter [Saprospiraceae bacterium]